MTTEQLLEVDDEYEPTLVTGAPIIDLDNIDIWCAKYSDGHVARLTDEEVAS